MNYIVFDLEWNQSPIGKEAENPLLPFEIIEIGAQKLNEQLEPCGSFHAIAKPVIYPTLHSHTQEIIGITEDDLAQGESFSHICQDFLAFCGKDCSFVTWGSMDLSELQRNMTYFNVPAALPKPLFYYDAQKLYSIAYEDGKSRRSLEYAIKAEEIPITVPFHRAHHDAYYTAQIFRKLNPFIIKTYFSVDYYQIPQNKKEEIHLHYPDYYKYVSRAFFRREEIMSDKTVTTIRCHICSQALRKKIRWFCGNNRIYYALSLCPEHGYVKGKIRMKKSDDGQYFAIKTVKMTDEEGAEKLRQMLEEIRRKRREHGKFH